MWDSIKYTNIHGVEVPEEEGREKCAENTFKEIMAEKFPNLRKETDIQRHNIIKMSRVKNKERNLKAAREKQQVTCKGNPHKAIS